MTDDLALALHTMADGEQPPVMDVERVLHEGRRSLVRRRMAALGGGTAVLAVTALAVGTLAGIGSDVQGDTDSAAASATYVVNPHDPVVTHWQFAYVPPGMVVYGGYEPAEEQMSTVLESASGRFQLDLVPMAAPILIGAAHGGPTEKVAVKVPGTTRAYWEGWGNGRITNTNGEGGEMATLDMQLKSGKWVSVIANGIEERADWKEQVLKAAANVVHRDRSVPMPFQVAGLPQSFTFVGGDTMSKQGAARADLAYRLGPDQLNPVVVDISASTSADGKQSASSADAKNTCKVSNGLTICVTSPTTDPAELKAIGGPQGLLDRVTSLGPDQANWTTDVIR